MVHLDSITARLWIQLRHGVHGGRALAYRRRFQGDQKPCLHSLYGDQQRILRCRAALIPARRSIWGPDIHADRNSLRALPCPIALGSKGAPPNINTERSVYAISITFRQSVSRTRRRCNCRSWALARYSARRSASASKAYLILWPFPTRSLALLIAINRLSDKYDRRGVLVDVAVASAVACAAMTVLSTSVHGPSWRQALPSAV